MYIPSAFRQTQPAQLFELIERHPFATLVAVTAAGLLANHQPLLLDREAGTHGVLRGHVARGNTFVDEALEGTHVLAIFHGPSAYVSPSWYPAKAEHGKVVPTWNFAAVHCKAILRFVRDETWLRAHLAQLTETHEHGRAQPWAIDDAPADFIATMMRGVVGLELEITDIEGKWKLGQNRAEADRVGAEQGLAMEADAQSNAVAHMMRHTRTETAVEK